MATQSNKENFLTGLANALEDQWLVDVRLKAGDSDEDSAISVHKLILGSRSKVFRKMFESEEVKTSANDVETVTLSEMKQEELEALVEFMYSDGSLLSAKGKQHFRSLYLVADRYEVLHLRDLCRDELISFLNSSNALEVLELAQNPFDKVLNDATFNYIKKNISTIASSDEFKMFVANNPDLSVEIMSASLSLASINDDEEVVQVKEEVVQVKVDEVAVVRRSTRLRKPNRKYSD
ncbi:unnamed protein product [Microthlaspi erraticum]|uniref:BTB domain-containing protein n=1 Tax=Microthlaspi erraticum TaxID=1685480 RepID=A0A6D2K868_9BRAS|nr:unnamed protein product [Microthlaspi erraticum]